MTDSNDAELTSEPTVLIVDDDEAFRDSLVMLCESVGLPVRSYESAVSFLEQWSQSLRGCLVLDVRMPVMSGIELQAELKKRGSQLPIVFMTGHGDVPMAVDAMKEGALDFITKPFSQQQMLDRIQAALRVERNRADERDHSEEVRARFAKLTPREREVMEHVVSGEANKVIASRLEISQRTVEIHRAQVMQKMAADSLADLVRDAIVLGL